MNRNNWRKVMHTTTFGGAIFVILTTVATSCAGGSCGGGDANGTAPRDSTGGSSSPQPTTQTCTYSSDCPTPLVCREVRGRGKVCTPQCREDRDCCPDGRATCGRMCREQSCIDGEPERCNGADDDRDAMTDEDFDLTADAANCGRCGLDCDAVLSHARSNGTTCAAGVCRLESDGCADAFFDFNHTDADGCEYACAPTKGGIEAPDGIDNDCDGAVDEGFDCANGDERPCGAGTGICEEGVQRCTRGRWSDCEDALGARDEVCNGLDDDCDGVADDGFTLATDLAHCGACGRDCRDEVRNADVACVGGSCVFRGCLAGSRDRNANNDDGCEPCPVAPVLAVDVCGNNQDDDCDGATDDGCACDPGDERRCGPRDALDNVGICRRGVQVCVAAADGSTSTWGDCVGAVEPLGVERCNREDDDCDGRLPAAELDGDQDGFTPCESDCLDTNRFVNPGMPGDLCNDVDDDCDGAVDEGFFVDAPCRGVGGCSRVGLGRIECAGPFASICSTDAEGSDSTAESEDCDHVDDDCNGVVDDVELAVVDSDARNCGACGVTCTVPNTVTACMDGACVVRGCVVGFMLQPDGSCLRCEEWPPRAESCDRGFVDEDCDGRRNEDCACVDGSAQPCGLDLALHGHGVCRIGTQRCAGGAWGACEGAVAPAAEACNGLDDDCDDVVPLDELDPDRDGVRACAGDCDDADRTVRPGTRETCDGRDEDCDGTVDEDFFVGVPCDGEGACGRGVYECDGADGFRCSTDLGGSRDGARPETCDGRDEDCDGVADDVDPARLAADARNCGACGVTCGFPNATARCADGRCVRVDCAPGFADVDGDPATGCEYRCAPTADPTDGPAAQCDGVDNDCDGSVDEGCACRDGTTRPCGPEAPACDLVTGECRGLCRIGVQRCMSGAWARCAGAVFPATEVCDGLDQDCTGGIPVREQDRDEDGFASCAGDCDDANAAIRPGVEELCDGRDNDCDGAIDEGFFVDAACEGEGACGRGRWECDGLRAFRCSVDPGGTAYPDPAPTETCDDRVDNDCDGSADEGCADCVPGVSRPCGVDLAFDGVGTCRIGVQTCRADRRWGDCLRAVGPMPEACNGMDEDCDGRADDGFDLATDPRNCGACANDCTAVPNVLAADCRASACAITACRPGWLNLDGVAPNGCEYGCFPTNGGIEQCDGIDNDCDGAVDDTDACRPPPPVRDGMAFAVTLPVGFPLDATRTLCATFADGVWRCGSYVLAVVANADGTTTVSAGGDAVSGRHVFNLCTATCDDSVRATWVVTRNADGTLSQSAVPLLTFAGRMTATSVVVNARGDGGNWYAELVAP